MSHTIKIRSKRHAAQIRKFVQRKGMCDSTGGGGVWRVGNYVHLWFDHPYKEFMVWSRVSYDRKQDTLTTLRELYTKEPEYQVVGQF